MPTHVVRLLKDYSFLLKIIGLVLACVCTAILSQDEEYTVPRWLWIIYSIDSMTYAVIFTSLSLAYIFEKERQTLEFTFLTIGVILYCVAGMAGIIRVLAIIPEGCETRDTELKLGIIFIVGSFLMMSDVIYKIYFEKQAVQNEDVTNTVEHENDL